MSPRAAILARRSFILLTLSAFGLFGFGCSSNNSNSFTSSYTATTTTPVPNVVKLVPKGASGNKLVVEVILYGPTTSQDLYSFSFDVEIGDPTVLAFETGSAVAGTALTAGAGQTIQVLAAPAAADPTHIVVGVSKLGGGNGNGVAGQSAAVVDLAFGFLKAGNSTLRISSNPVPAATDHNGAIIGSINFDAAAGTATGVQSSGGGY